MATIKTTSVVVCLIRGLLVEDFKAPVYNACNGHSNWILLRNPKGIKATNFVTMGENVMKSNLNVFNFNFIRFFSVWVKLDTVRAPL